MIRQAGEVKGALCKNNKHTRTMIMGYLYYLKTKASKNKKTKYEECRLKVYVED